ncbi:MAG TPA: Rieske 2Fe-2S domain-containing protein [Myxococcales bacterium]|nr:Rieske 2Fe-2S domain-containing protein [Myxococcales bacterium]
MSDAPRWKQDFPILWDEDHYVTRRELAKFLTLGSGTIVAATVGVAAIGDRLRPQGKMEPMRIEGADTLERGGSLLFRYPTGADPCILLRLADGRLAAYSQVCTHLSCAVVHEPAADELYCPCHEGHFDCADGRPTAGPPTRRLPRVLLAETARGVFALGVEV